MNDKELIRVDEKIYSKYKPKLKRCVRLHKDFDNNSEISKLKNAKVQIQFLDFYNKLKNDLVKDIKISEFKKLLTTMIFFLPSFKSISLISLFKLGPFPKIIISFLSKFFFISPLNVPLLVKCAIQRRIFKKL